MMRANEGVAVIPVEKLYRIRSKTEAKFEEA
jgi:hypothetical protein